MKQETVLPPYNIHQNIRLLRLFAGLSQTDMARKLGVTHGWISKLESGVGDLTVSQLMVIRNEFGVSADELLDGAIDYLRVAKKFNHPVLLPKRYSNEATAKMGILYGFLALYSKELGREATLKIVRSLGIKPHLVADPMIPVNVSLLIDLIVAGLKTSAFKDADLARNYADYAVKQLLGNETRVGGEPREAYEIFLARLNDVMVDCEIGVTAANGTSLSVQMGCFNAALKRSKHGLEPQSVIQSCQVELLRKVGEMASLKSVTVSPAGESKPGHVPREYAVSWA